MATATETRETEKMIIEITLTREVNDKVSYADGYNLIVGREVYESYDVIIKGKITGKTIVAHGKPGGFAFFSTGAKFATMPTGAFARIGDAYVSKDTYDVAMNMIASLDAKVTKTDEQVELEKIVIVDSPVSEPKHGENGYCRKCHSYCYGDCES